MFKIASPFTTRPHLLVPVERVGLTDGSVLKVALILCAGLTTTGENTKLMFYKFKFWDVSTSQRSTSVSARHFSTKENILNSCFHGYHRSAMSQWAPKCVCGRVF